jgi:hypothetical protein
MAEVQVGRRRVETGLDSQRPPGAQALGEVSTGNQVYRTAPEQRELGFNRLWQSGRGRGLG